MSEVGAMAGRVRAAQDRLRSLPQSDSHQPGPPDPRTGDRWDRFNVLGHTAEMLAFWSRELGRVLAGGGRLGREPGSSARLEGVEGGRLIGERALRERIDAGVESLQALLGRLQDEDLERPIDTITQGEITLRQALETFLVGHFEAHVAQLESLP